MDKFESSYNKFASGLTVLCFDCGGSFNVPYDTPNPTRACPKCLDKMWETQTSFEE
jgi:uncharacterized paraquat-inducible protein A